MLERARSEILVRLERLLSDGRGDHTVRGIQACLEHDTSDAERPCVRTTADAWWSSPAIDHHARAVT